MSSKWPNEARVQVSNLLNRIIMCDLELSFYGVDDLAMKASDLLDQFRKRGMPDSIQRKVLDKTYEANDLAKLRELVARFEAVIQTHDADVAAAQAALSAHASLAMEHVDGIHASFSASPSFSTALPSSGATNGNPNGREGNTNAKSQPGAVPGASPTESLHDKIKQTPQ